MADRDAETVPFDTGLEKIVWRIVSLSRRLVGQVSGKTTSLSFQMARTQPLIFQTPHTPYDSLGPAVTHNSRNPVPRASGREVAHKIVESVTQISHNNDRVK